MVQRLYGEQLYGLLREYGCMVSHPPTPRCSLKAGTPHGVSATPVSATPIAEMPTDGDYTEVPHDHDFHELVLITAGAATHVVAGQALSVAAGDVFMLRGPLWHTFRQRDRLMHINVSWYPERLQLPVCDLQQVPGFRELFEYEPQLQPDGPPCGHMHLEPHELSAAETLIARMLREQTIPGPTLRPSLTAQLTELMLLVSSAQQRTPRPAAPDMPTIRRLTTHLERHPAHPWTLDELAQHAGMSRRGFTAAFRSALGCSPMQYLLQLRCRLAAQALTNTQEPVTRIALRHGFSDSNYFARQFRRVMQTSPSEYRARSQR